MRHEHLVVTVEAGTKARIEDDLDSGETVEAWVADAIEEKLADESAREASDASPRGDDLTEETEGTDADRPGEDDYDEGFEYVDDCSI